MHIITKLIENIRENGNCKIYISSKQLNYNIKGRLDNSLKLYEFYVDAMGDLEVCIKNESFDKDYWTDNKIDTTATNLETKIVRRYQGDQIFRVIALIICQSFKNDNVLIRVNNNHKKSVDTTHATYFLYNSIMRLLNLSNKDITELVNIPSDKEMENILFSKMDKSLVSRNLSFEELAESLETKMNLLDERYCYIRELWERLRSHFTAKKVSFLNKSKLLSVAKDDELAYLEWLLLEEDDTLIEPDLDVMKLAKKVS